MILRSEDVLFVGKGKDVVPWYRTGMPSFHLGCDWVGVLGEPGGLKLETSLKRGGQTMPDFESYKIIVLQQVAGKKWLRQITDWQRKGIKVIYEVDDYLHGVRKVKGHIAAKGYTQKRLKDFELCMRVCDAMIVSTEWLAEKYRKFNSRVYVCRNSIEGTRYRRFRLPERQTINVGWAGGVGHQESIERWLPAIQNILDSYEDVRFVSIGLPAADWVRRPRQAFAIPFTSIENFPAVLCNFDIGIAPAGRNTFFMAKSDLRWLETGALGIPLVADPFVYKDIRDHDTGYLAETPEEAQARLEALIEDETLRSLIGQGARDHVLRYRSIEQGIEQWERVFVAVWDS
jgi:glycosyltransferase involved in cell wall biosynthesis